jgi:hypothetical protein
MHDRRHFHSVVALVGPDSDRDGMQLFFDQAGYHSQIFKNPEVFFDELKGAQNPIVILETKALKSKLSEWVMELGEVRPGASWIAVAPISQYAIVSSYQSRDLADFVQDDQPYLLQRLLWSVDRLAKREEAALSKKRLQEELMLIRQAQFIEKKKTGKNFSERLRQRLNDHRIKQKPLTVLALALDDESEVRSFWGLEVLQKARALLKQGAIQKWGDTNIDQENDRIFVMISKTTTAVLLEAREFQESLQNQGRIQLGFRISLSGGLAERDVHASQAHQIQSLTEQALQRMQQKGGGRVGVPRAIPGGISGDLPSDLG